MAGLADDWAENRQICVDILCAYLRMPYAPDPGEDAAEPDRLAFQADREVRHTAIRVITAHLRSHAEVSWQGLNLDFTGVVFDGGDFSRAKFSGDHVSFAAAVFSRGQVDFDYAVFSSREADFSGAKFSGGHVSFACAEFAGRWVDFRRAEFSGGTVFFGFAEFSGREVSFADAVFSGGRVDFIRAKFSGSTVFFHSAEFSGAQVGFGEATFSGGKVDFSGAVRWSLPPSFDFGSSPPPAVLLPGILQANSADSPIGSAVGDAPETD